LRIALGLLVLASALDLAAQTAPKVDLAVAYTGQRSLEAGTGENFWSQGGALTLGTNLWHGLGVAADLAGSHAASIGSSGIPLSLVTTTFGVRYRWHGDHRLSPYGQGLVGEAHGFDSLFPTNSGSHISADSLAILVGGGLDIKLSNHLAARAIDAAWLRTQLPNATENVQNNLRLGAGIVLRFGH